MNIFLGFVLVIACAATVRAQGREQYTISAKAGGINFVSGDAAVRRKGVAQWQQLSPSDDIESGDVVRTGADGRVEMLLSPGSYLRAAENTEIDLADNSLDSLRVRLIRGSAVVEVAGADEARVAIQVDTPQAKVTVDRKGLYRVNAQPGGATEVLVRKGEAMVSSSQTKPTKVKDGKMAVVNNADLAVAKLNKEDQDAFDQWSRQRSEELVAASRKLSKDAIARSYSSYRNSGLGGYRSLAGLWVHDPFSGCRTFLPFYSGWSSPYGHSYSSGFGFPWHRHSGVGIRIGGGHNSSHRSDYFSSRPHSGQTHHSSPAHRSSAHHRRGH